MFASFDPIALDFACAEAVNAQTPTADSLLGEALAKLDTECSHDVDFFSAVAPNTNWRALIDHGIKMGLGTDQYELVTV
jgi:uncharacterized Fe-S center protein